MSRESWTDRVDRLESYAREGRILRSAWAGERGGRHMACLLAALSPEAGAARDPDACPADVMPSWLAHLLPHIDDHTPADPSYREPMLLRWGPALRPSQSWSEATWDVLRRRHLVRCLDLAVGPVTEDEWGVGAAVAEARRLLVEGGTDQEWDAARDAARAGALAARAAGAGTAARAAALAAARAAAEAALAADRAAETAARAAGWAAARAATWAALTDALLDDLEAVGREEVLHVA